MPPLIAKIRHDAIVKMKYPGDCICREYSQLKHTKIWMKIDQYLQRYNQFSKNMMTS